MVHLDLKPGQPAWPLLREFMNQILDIELNQSMSVAKWVSVFASGFIQSWNETLIPRKI